MAMHSDRHIVNLALIGFMGAGKTSVGRLVAEQLHFDYLDTDELIQSRTGRTIADIFKTDGEPAFRALERQVVAELAEPGENGHLHRRRFAGESGESRQPQDPCAGRLPLGLAGKNLGTRAKPDAPSLAP